VRTHLDVYFGFGFFPCAIASVFMYDVFSEIGMSHSDIKKSEKAKNMHCQSVRQIQCLYRKE
jgi:hypothetical protein